MRPKHWLDPPTAEIRVAYMSWWAASLSGYGADEIAFSGKPSVGPRD
jgi:hypothetical protein